jgi:hypothetical protein
MRLISLGLVYNALSDFHWCFVTRAKNIILNTSPTLWFIISLLAIAGVAMLGPEEATLGSSVRVVYLHGAWVWAALAAFIAAAAVGLIGLMTRQERLHSWSRAFGRTGLFFWITYLPISLWAMQTNWNGLFLAEPRWRFAMVFAISGVLLQLGLSFLPVIWSSVGNLGYVITLFMAMRATENVMHPPGPMLESDFGRIQLFFAFLTGLVLFAAWQFARWLYTLAQSE